MILSQVLWMKAGDQRVLPSFPQGGPPGSSPAASPNLAWQASCGTEVGAL